MEAAGSPPTVHEKNANLLNVPDVSAANASWWAAVIWIVCFVIGGILLN